MKNSADSSVESLRSRNKEFQSLERASQLISDYYRHRQEEISKKENKKFQLEVKREFKRAEQLIENFFVKQGLPFDKTKIKQLKAKVVVPDALAGQDFSRLRDSIYISEKYLENKEELINLLIREMLRTLATSDFHIEQNEGDGFFRERIKRGFSLVSILFKKNKNNLEVVERKILNDAFNEGVNELLLYLISSANKKPSLAEFAQKSPYGEELLLASTIFNNVYKNDGLKKFIEKYLARDLSYLEEITKYYGPDSEEILQGLESKKHCEENYANQPRLLEKRCQIREKSMQFFLSKNLNEREKVRIELRKLKAKEFLTGLKRNNFQNPSQ